MIFIDGVGLGDDNPETNPFSAAHFPTLTKITNGKKWLNSTGKIVSDRAVFIPTDPRLNVAGRPQSATGQAVIITGKNVPLHIGRHYGPKPNVEIRALLDEDNFFTQVVKHNKRAALLEAYPDQWHRGINSGKSLPSSYQYAARSAGLPFFDHDTLKDGNALSGDWTGEGWRTQLGFDDIPVFAPLEAGEQLVKLSRNYDFAFMSHWLTDVIGHKGDLTEAIALLSIFDKVIEGVLKEWHDDEGLVIVTSDHGNIEEITHRRHTENDVPTVIIGNGAEAFAKGLSSLQDYVPRMAKLLLD